MNFKKGDIVVFNEYCSLKFSLTPGKQYKVLQVISNWDENCIIVTDDTGRESNYYVERFIKLEDFRNNLINDILK